MAGVDTSAHVRAATYNDVISAGLDVSHLLCNAISDFRNPNTIQDLSTSLEPPRKRQRLSDNGAQVSAQRPESIVIAQVNVNLGTEDSVTFQTHSVPGVSNDEKKFTEVCLQAADLTDQGSLKIALGSHTHPAATLQLDCILDRPEDTIRYLRPILDHGLKQNPKDLIQTDVAWAECIVVAQQDASFRIEAKICWRDGYSTLDVPRGKSKTQRFNELLALCMPGHRLDLNEPWTLQDFYRNVHVPSTDLVVPEQITNVNLTSKLYPFQQRAVHWLLQREGVEFRTASLMPTPAADCTEETLPPSFQEAEDALGRNCYVSHSRGTIVSDIWALSESRSTMRGGVLAEEMGLGKTLELIALICLHKRTLTSPTVHDQYSGTTVQPSRGTLIISPPAILEQWMSEIKTHAPHLSVLHYQGIPSASRASKTEDWTVENLLKYDVVLTTYTVLAREIHYANKAPERNFRWKKKYEQHRSPLVQISWWRVCLDEAQMIESGVSQAATVARLIPRCNCWAVTGTPLKKDVQDLLGLLIFLRYEPYCSSKRLWQAVDKVAFRDIFSRIAMRHTKDLIRDELRLPPQKRVVITIPFTAIEEQNYSQQVKQMCEDCGMTAEGAPATEEFDPANPAVVAKMREWLRRLRQTCLHPQVGGRNRRALGRNHGPLRTVAEVLEVMIDQNGTALLKQERDLILAQVVHGHIQANVKDDVAGKRSALATYETALKDASKLVEEARKEYDAEKEKAVAVFGQIVDANLYSDAESDVEGQQQDQNTRLINLRKALRSALEVQHVCTFFVATAFYLLQSDKASGPPIPENLQNLKSQEAEYYDRAQSIRREILQESQSKAQRLMRKIVQKSNKLSQVPVLPILEDLGGIESRKILEKMDLVGDLLDTQAKQIVEWRKLVIDILLKPLVDDEGKDFTGDEYEDSTKIQDELYVYIAALRALVADRTCILTGQLNMLIEHEVKASLKLAKDGQGHAPELFLKVMATRAQLVPGKNTVSLREIVTDIRSMATSMQWQKDGGSARAGAELVIVERQLHEVQQAATTQTKAVTDIEHELTLFRNTMNLRLEFYRQLQHISDQVAPYREEQDEELDTVALARQIQFERRTRDTVESLRTKRRFLLHLRLESRSQDQARICVICQETFENGVLTVCGHQYCKDCIKMWYSSHRSCPTCKRHLNIKDFHDITYKPQELRAQEEQQSPAPSEKSSRDDSMSPRGHSTIYSGISSTQMDEIKSIELDGSYGTKIDTLARHLLWIRENDPGSKSVVFSQYTDFLRVLEEALRQFKIGFTAISKTGIEKFKKDPNAECFLLDAKSDSSGLNLVNATYVFLCEPLINAAIELQAIARVHRIGQQRPTTVYMYLISDTVEEVIYELSVQRRLAHMGRGKSSSISGSAAPLLQERALDAANSLEMQQAPIASLIVKGKSGGEVVEEDDLWKCLFGKRRTTGVGVSAEMQMEVDRHLRAEAATQRTTAGGCL